MGTGLEREANCWTRAQLPSWGELCGCVPRPSGYPLDEEIENAVSRENRLLMRIVNAFIRFKSRSDPSYLKLLDTTWEEAIYLVFDQVIRAQQRDPSKAVALPSNERHLNRRFVQLPCSKDTLERRVKLFEARYHRADPILILGDDDFFSLALVQSGFEDVTVLDIDQDLCLRIVEASRKLKLRLNVVAHNLENPLPSHLVRPYKVVFMDPIYSPDGIRLFLGSAVKCTDASQTEYLVCVYLLSLFKNGNRRLAEILDELQLAVEEVHDAFNVYPLPKSLQRWIWIFNRVLVRSSFMFERGFGVPSFSSDLLILRSK
jgi:hypothetical protein